MEEHDLDGGAPRRKLALPGWQDRERRDDEVRPVAACFLERREERDHLQRLAQAHLIAEDPAYALAMLVPPQPSVTVSDE